MHFYFKSLFLLLFFVCLFGAFNLKYNQKEDSALFIKKESQFISFFLTLIRVYYGECNDIVATGYRDV